MKRIEIIESLLLLLREKSIPFSELYLNSFENKVRKSEFSSCIRDLQRENFVDYIGNFNDSRDVVLTRYGEEMIERCGTYSKYLKSKSAMTLYDRVVKWGKNNFIIVVLLFIIAIATSLATFSDSFRKIISLNRTVSNDSLKTVPSKKDSLGLSLDNDTFKGKEEDKNVSAIVPDTSKVAPPSLKNLSRFCQDIYSVLNDRSGDFGRLEKNEANEYGWSTKFSVEDAISNSVAISPEGIEFFSTFYEGKDTLKARTVYQKLKKKLSCVGKVGQDFEKEAKYTFCEIYLDDKIIKLMFSKYPSTEEVEVYISIKILE